MSAVVLSVARRVKPWEDRYQSIAQKRAGVKQQDDHIPQKACDNVLDAPRRGKFSLSGNVL